MQELKNLIADELRLISLLSCPSLDYQQIQQVNALIPFVNLDRLKEQLEHHRVWPCFYCNVRDYTLDLFPLFFIDWLEDKYRKSVIQTQQQFITMYNVIRSLNQAGIIAIPFKGISLAKRLYGDVAKRQCNDVDIIIEASNLEKAHKILVNAGYSCFFYDELTAAQKKLYFDVYKDLTYCNSNGELLELHIRLSSNSIPLTRRVQQKLLATENFNILPAVDELLYLSWHGTHSLHHRIKWLCDIALYLNAHKDESSIFLEQLLETAKSLDCERSLICCLVLSHLLYNTPLNCKIMESYSNDKVTQWFVKKSLKALNDPINVQNFRFNYERSLSDIVSHKRLKNVFSAIVYKTKPNLIDIQVLPRMLSKRFAFLCYVLRPFMLSLRLIFRR